MDQAYSLATRKEKSRDSVYPLEDRSGPVVDAGRIASGRNADGSERDGEASERTGSVSGSSAAVDGRAGTAIDRRAPAGGREMPRPDGTFQ